MVQPSDVPLFYHHLCHTVSPCIFYVPPWDKTLFQYQMFCCYTILVPMFQNLFFTVSAIYVLLLYHHMFHCSTIRCFTVQPSDVLLFHHQMLNCYTIISVALFHYVFSTVQPSDVPLFHYQMFYCSNIRCSSVPPPLFHCSIIRCSTVPPSDLPLFHHKMFYFSTFFVPLVHHQMFDCSTIRCSTVPTSPFPCSTVLLFNHLCSTVPP